MFWGKNKPGSHVPKTPKMPSVSLPDERYTPIPSHVAYMEKTPRNGFFRRFTTDQRPMTPSQDSWDPRYDHPSGRSRARTVSNPGRNIEAPRPVRPHPSQGPYIPVIEHYDSSRGDFSRGLMAPVGTPSAAYLEQQIQREREARSLHLACPPPDMFTRPDYEFAEEKKLREVAKRTGVKVSREVSKAWLDELAARKKAAEALKAPSAPPTNRRPAKAAVDHEDQDHDLKKKKPKSFDEWNAVPLDMGPAKPTPEVDPKAPLKSALKKTSSIKPPNHDREHSTYSSKGYYSEHESDKKKKDERHRPPRVTTIPSKAYLEEQQERLEESRRGWSSSQYVSPHTHRSSVHDIRPAMLHTHSSSTSSPESVTAPYDRNGHRSRPRHGSFSERTRPVVLSTNYTHPYIPGFTLKNPMAATQKAGLIESHGILTWPLVDYESRRHEGFPPLYFDIAFSPSSEKSPAKVKRSFHYSPLTREEMEMPMVMGTNNAPEVYIWSKNLSRWPVVINLTGVRPVPRVIDVLNAIYNTYNVPIMAGEMQQIGMDYIHRCERAFRQRCVDSSDFTHNEERRGMLRVDMLRGRKIFKGIVPIAGAPHHFELFFDES